MLYSTSNSVLERIIICGLVLLFSFAGRQNALGQKRNFSGSWLLEYQQSLSGGDYGNGLPKQIRLAQSKNKISIITVTLEENGLDTANYMVKLDGTPLFSRSSSGKNKAIQFEYTSDSTELIETITYTLPNETVPVHTTKIKWNMDGEEKSIELVREDKYEKSEENWSMKGVYSRSGLGISFVKGLSWEQIKAKATAEGKHIFVDCYASWCGPCKKMENEVYPLDKVGDFMNTRFICLKLQIDTTAKDDDEVKDRYPDANYLVQRYGISGFPSFLFFSPDGNIVHRDLGFKTSDEFISVAGAAMDPSKQYYTLLEAYKKGKKDDQTMQYLALSAKTFGDKDMAVAIAKDYKTNYLNKLSEADLYKKKLIDFVTTEFHDLYYDDGSNGKFFRLFYNHPDQVDSIMGFKGFSEFYVDNIVAREEIYFKIWNKNELMDKRPDWATMAKSITNKYNREIAVKLIRNAQLDFYTRTNKWRNYAKMVDELIKLYPPKAGGHDFMNAVRDMGDDVWALNAVAWKVFMSCNDKQVQNTAIRWTELAIKLSSNANKDLAYIVDTKANLLYKSGRVREAVACEELAANLNVTEEKKRSGNSSSISPYRRTIEKMQNGTPTWPKNEQN